MNREDIIVFIEKIEKLDNNNYYLLMDFLPKDVDNDPDENFFINAVGNDIVKSDQGSMMAIEIIQFSDGEEPKEDHYYKLPEEIYQLKWQNTDADTSNDFIGYVVTTVVEEMRNFGDPVGKIYENDKYSEYPSILSAVGVASQIRLMNQSVKCLRNVNVFKVGQANCNLILKKDRLLLYDFGYMLGPNKTEMIKKLKGAFRVSKIERILTDKNVPKMFVLSHWDVDHYNAIKANVDKLKNCIDFFIVPNVLPNKTSRAVAQLLISNNVENVFPIDMLDSKKHDENDLSPINREVDNTFIIYRAVKQNNRNKSGLIVTYDTDDHKYILPGDHHYEQLDRLNTNKDVSLVVPHHGGQAGRFDNTLNDWPNIKQAAFSHGNRYGHPEPNMTEFTNYSNQINIIDLAQDTLGSFHDLHDMI